LIEMAKAQKHTQLVRAVHRVGEGAQLDVVHRSLVKADGTTSAMLGINLAQAPVPERRYVAEVGGISYSNEAVRIMFGQIKLGTDALRSLLVIHMGPIAVRQFLASVKEMQNPSLDEIANREGVHSEDLRQVVNEPEQTVAFAANIIAAAVSGREACLDFYQASSFSMATAVRSNSLAVDPVVRVDLRTSLLVAIIAELDSIKKKFPAAEQEV
jgi:hypothetical protein